MNEMSYVVAETGVGRNVAIVTADAVFDGELMTSQLFTAALGTLTDTP